MDTKALRQKILDLAIHGKLVPQDPNDEPASVLLERIRAEKERLIKEGKIKKGKKSAKTSDKPHYPYELPKGWVWTTLGEISNYGINTSVKVEEIDDNNWVLELEDIEKDSAKLIQKLSKNKREIKGTRHKFYKGNILYSKLRTYLNKVLIASEDGYCTTEIMPFDTYGILSNEYICHVLRSSYFLDYTLQCGYGVKMPRLSTTDACNGVIPLPPLHEQYRIVKEIKRWFTLISMIEKEKDNLRETIKQAKAKVLDLAIHGKLVPQNPNDEPASELLKRINPKAEIITDNGHYQKLPVGWTICKLKDICSKLVDGDHNPPKGTKETTEYLMLSAQNIVNDNIVYTNGVRYLNHDAFETSDKRTKVMQGDLLITIVGTLGRSCVFSDNKKITLQRSVACLTPLIYNHFLKYYMDSSSIQKYMTTNAKGTAQKGFYLNQLEQLPIMIPPLTEQQRIVARIEKIFARLDVIESAL